MCSESKRTKADQKYSPNSAPQNHKHKKQGIQWSDCGLAIYLKKYLKEQEELWKLKYFTMQKYTLQKILSKKPESFKILELYYN
jgi:hypothetical protein